MTKSDIFQSKMSLSCHFLRGGRFEIIPYPPRNFLQGGRSQIQDLKSSNRTEFGRHATTTALSLDGRTLKVEVEVEGEM